MHVRVDHPEWMSSLLGTRETLQKGLQHVAAVPLAGVHFLQVGAAQLSHCRAPDSVRGHRQNVSGQPVNSSQPLKGRPA